jgi:hypothetical protein
LGIGFSCSECGVRTGEHSGESVWFFSGPLEVTSVTPGGAADEAGVQMGDFIEAIDGHPVETDAGGRAFSGIEAGEPLRLTLVKRNGRETEVELVPREPRRGGMPRGVVTPAPVPEAEVEPAVPLRPRGEAVPDTPPEPVLLPFTLSFHPPGDWPLRYSGTIERVEVEVRGEPVSVGERREERTGVARTLVIQGQGLWIRVTLPPGASGSGG